MKLISLLSLIFLLLYLAQLANFVVTASDVRVITSKNFEKEVLKNELPYFVEFYAPWCGHCKNLAPTWEQVATNLKGIIPVGKVDCTTEEALCKKNDVKGFPTLKLFVNGKPINYDGARTAKALVDFALSKLPQNVIKIKEDTLDNFLSKKSEKPHVVLFTSKPTTPPLFKSLATRFKNQIIFGEVSDKQKKLVDSYQISKFPAVIAFVPGNTEKITYDGEVTPEALVEWLHSLLPEQQHEEEQEQEQEQRPQKEEQKDEEETKTEPKESKKTAPSPPKTNRKSKDIIEVTESNLDTVCDKVICVVALVETEMSSENKPRYEYIKEEQREILDKISSFYKDDIFTFVWANKDQAESFFTKFKALSQQDKTKPLLFVYNKKRGKYAVASHFDTETIMSFLDRVLGGDIKYERVE
jgi:protein disulfide-isomerase-like protein